MGGGRIAGQTSVRRHRHRRVLAGGRRSRCVASQGFPAHAPGALERAPQQSATAHLPLRQRTRVRLENIHLDAHGSWHARIPFTSWFTVGERVLGELLRQVQGRSRGSGSVHDARLPRCRGLPYRLGVQPHAHPLRAEDAAPAVCATARACYASECSKNGVHFAHSREHTIRTV